MSSNSITDRDNLVTAIQKAFVDSSIEAYRAITPNLVTNDLKKKRFVLNQIDEELRSCTGFTFSVAFITEAGLAALKLQLLDLAKKGIKGRIITSNYLGFNSPKTFRELLKLKNVEVRISGAIGFHAKGYLFHHNNYDSVIIGSSNLTIKALKENYEWNFMFSSLEQGEITAKVSEDIENLWEESSRLTLEWIEKYELTYNPVLSTKHIDTNYEDSSTLKWIDNESDEEKNGQIYPSYDESQESRVSAIAEGEPAIDFCVNKKNSDNIKNIKALKTLIKPNKMQERALNNLDKLRKEGASRALVISATGSGKTILAALDVKQMKPKRFLFVVHREQILRKAKKEFFKVLGGNYSDYGFLTGSKKNYKAKYLFASIATLSKIDNLHMFSPNDFDYMVIDEAHHVGAESYQKVINYFEPNFVLGMTATPERTQVNERSLVFEIFQHYIAYEIRLEEALNENLLCPFHYYGITDYTFDGDYYDDKINMALWDNKEKLESLIDKINYFGYSGVEGVKGLIFVSRVEEARNLSQELNLFGLRTKSLGGMDNDETRDQAMKDLENGKLDYLISVNILNEGIDIPKVNQIVMLRKTESSIVFIQQLGRGLRKDDSKDYLTIIDFIGNYDNNYMIPMALSSDKSLDKNILLKKTLDLDYFTGISTIHFDEVARKKIFESIKTARLSTASKLKDAYWNLKDRLGRIPFLMDFIKHNSVDPSQLVLAPTNPKRNYYRFLEWLGETSVELDKQQNQFLNIFTKVFMSGIRPHELLLLFLLMKKTTVYRSDFEAKIREFNWFYDDQCFDGIMAMFDLRFYGKNTVSSFGKMPIATIDPKNNNAISLSRQMITALNCDFFRILVQDIVSVGFYNSKKYDSTRRFTINQKYGYTDVCRLLNWKVDINGGAIGGYMIREGFCPIFINYHKQLDENSSIAYEDNFISENIINWSSKNNRTLESKEIKRILGYGGEKLLFPLFVRKFEGEDFFYLGQSKVIEGSAQNQRLNNKNVVHFKLKLETPVDRAVYRYFNEI